MAAKLKVKTNVEKKVKSRAATKAESRAKPKAEPKTNAAAKKAVVKLKVAHKEVTSQSDMKLMPVKKMDEVKAPVKAAEKPSLAVKPLVPIIKRTVSPILERRRPIKKHSQRGNQFNFMKAPGTEYAFEVGDTVEVFCDHEKNRDRIRGWVKGTVVQVDHKLAAVQFRSNVYLTDGWMVPDRILWFPLNSEHIRPVVGKKPVEKKDFIPDY